MSTDRFDHLRPPLALGALQLPHRLLMAPLTRNRADDDGSPNPLMAEYYRQRAGSAALIVSEATWVVPAGKPYPRTPGLATDAHRDGWRAVTDAVHAEGGLIVAQLWHGGRVSHPATSGEPTVSASAIGFDALTVFTPDGSEIPPVPRALALDELPAVVSGYVEAARRAIEAGFDGVEVHGANGYLLHQFLADGTNLRDDEYGGDAEGRARLTVEVVSAVSEAIGADRVGLRLSPGFTGHEMVERDGGEVYRVLADALRPLGLAYVHLVGQPGDPLVEELRGRFGVPLVLNTGFTAATERADAIAIVAGDQADAVAVGRAFIANPDLWARWEQDAALNEPDKQRFYGGGPAGYVDYPALAGEPVGGD